MRIAYPHVRCHIAFAAACIAVLAAGSIPEVAQARFDTVQPSERIGFQGAPVGKRWVDATAFGAWYSLHDGFGRTQVESTARGPVLTLTTRAPASPDTTFSSLVHTRRAFEDVDFSLSLRTVAQLRRPTPNPWEVAWVLWRYTDNEHFYSFIVKPNGFELAKQDKAYRGSQRFLAVSYSRLFPTGAAYRVRVRHVDEHHDRLGQRRPHRPLHGSRTPSPVGINRPLCRGLFGSIRAA